MTQILNQLLERMQSKVSALNYTTWFKTIADATLKDDVFIMVVPNRFVADWINDFYGDLIRRELYAMTKNNCRLGYEILPGQDEMTGSNKTPNPALHQPVRRRLIEMLNPRYTFDRFVVGASNQFAHAACKAVADLPGARYNPLFIYGGVGLGKTHLLHAAGIQLMESRPGTQVIYVGAERFMNELINALRYQRMPEFRKKYRDNCDILLIDDLQFIGGKECTLDEFFHTFNTLHESRRQVVMTADKSPRELLGMEERLRTRIEWGLVADIGSPDLETRVAILMKKAQVFGLQCPDEVAMFLASSIKTNIRELEGSLIRINAFAALAKAPITVEFAKEVLRDALRDKAILCSIESIQRIVADFYKIAVSDLKSPRRLKHLAHPRQVAMYLCKKHVRSAYPEIGFKFGGKDHTTVMYACRKIEKLLEDDNGLRNDVSAIEKSILH